MHTRTLVRTLIVGLVCLLGGLAGREAGGQTCGPGWLGSHVQQPNTIGTGGSAATVFAMVPWDPDGPNGPLPTMLAVGGNFNVGGLVGVALWDGRNWLPIGTGIAGSVHALTVDSAGDLIAAGVFNFLANGTPVSANIARYRISASPPAWESIGLGLSGGAAGLTEEVDALTRVSGGFVAAGTFATATNTGGGTVNVNHIAKWNDSTSTWNSLGGGFADYGDDESFFVSSLAVLHPEQPDEALVAGGEFLTANNVNPTSALSVSFIAIWDGGHWSTVNGATVLANGTDDEINALAVLSNGNLVAAGEFMSIENVACLGVGVFAAGQTAPFTWQSMSSGLTPLDEAGVFALGAVPPGVLANGDLVAGGDFLSTGDGALTLNRVAIWSNGNQTWSQMGPSANPGFANGKVRAIAVVGGSIYAAGSFSTAFDNSGMSVYVGNVARWDATNGVWAGVFSAPVMEQVGYNVNPTADGNVGAITPMNYSVMGIAVNAGALIGGSFDHVGGIAANNIACFSGAGWTALGSGVNGAVIALAGDGLGHFAVSGYFTDAGGVAVAGIALWDDTTRSWSPMDNGLGGAANALVFNPVDSRFYAGTGFGVATWDGTTWTYLSGSPAATDVRALVVYKATGTITTPWAANGDVIAGGQFGSMGGVTNTRSIARWSRTGQTWNALDFGINNTTSGVGSVKCLAVVASANPALNGNVLAGGDFPSAGPPPDGVSFTAQVARFDGGAWNSVSGGTFGLFPGSVNSMAVGARISANGTRDIFFGGTFDYNSFNPGMRGIARWSDDGMGGGLGSGIGTNFDNHDVKALAVLPSGELEAGGVFTVAGGNGVVNLARWSDTGIPWIAAQPPRGQDIVNVGGNVTIPVMPAGGYDFAGPLSFQWKKGATAGSATLTDVHNGPGGASAGGGTVHVAANGSLTITGVHKGDMGWYSVVVSNGCGPGLRSTEDDLGVNCPADFNHSGTLTIQDLFDFLTAWFTGCTFPSPPCPADFNHSNGLSTQDIFDYLNAWFAGC